MSAFDLLSPLERSFFSLWTLLLCLACMIGVILSVAKKRYVFVAFSLIVFAPSYLMWQVLFDLSLSGTAAAGLSRTLCAEPLLLWLGVLLVLSVSAALILVYNIRYAKRYITPGAIKSYMDEIPCGVCCWREDGRVFFSNMLMDRLSVALLGESPRNGNRLREAVASGTLSVDEKMWRFTCQELVFGHDRVYEMIASDITVEYAKTQALERDKAELSRLNSELKTYTLGIDETVRRQEILAAKINIHDEMNRLMLSTMAAESRDAATLDAIFLQWEQNALLLGMGDSGTSDHMNVTRIEELANALKIRLSWKTELPQRLDKKQRDLFFLTAQEAIVNAAKHAEASTMTISFEGKESEIECRFVNDGKMPMNDVSFTGGLANLAQLAERACATISTQVGDTFALTLRWRTKIDQKNDVPDDET